MGLNDVVVGFIDELDLLRKASFLRGSASADL